ncbi:uncharacterized protein ASCRUDRAFT_116153 [Ascoidea rubescens DSM 1968]|uniref:Uncharacterized protein n=1 Tax=Ascoidea rubescens DSM 1968 TaxID=1344418 RepID=A0A1D2VBT2_9ASCO|nr:hypothetical protein ASCRUDRAFT_116153 [Ascoidea rubescens DSM 1968]ODV59086.1 hypothetical protein ASCRUDRAFT_116153 [Ascoidea rubescens DSM 1968]
MDVCAHGALMGMSPALRKQDADGCSSSGSEVKTRKKRGFLIGFWGLSIYERTKRHRPLHGTPRRTQSTGFTPASLACRLFLWCFFILLDVPLFLLKVLKFHLQVIQSWSAGNFTLHCSLAKVLLSVLLSAWNMPNERGFKHKHNKKC